MLKMTDCILVYFTVMRYFVRTSSHYSCEESLLYFVRLKEAYGGDKPN